MLHAISYPTSYKHHTSESSISSNMIDGVRLHHIPILNNLTAVLIHTPDVPGKFDLKKALALGIPKGPLFGKLKTGQSITLNG